MRQSLHSALLLGLCAFGGAIFQDEVGDVDFHYALLGHPQPETTFFHRPRRDDRASLLYTLSDIGILGAVNPSNGDLIWRHEVVKNATSGDKSFLRAPDGDDWVVAAHGSAVSAWNALTGRNVWHMEFSERIRDVEILQMTETSHRDVLVLFDDEGVTVLRRLHGTLGSVVWEFRDTRGHSPLQVSNDVTHVFAIGLEGAAPSYSLRIVSLDVATGSLVDVWSVGSKDEIQTPQDVMFVGANSAAPIVAWTDPGLSKLSINALGSRSKQDFHLPPDTMAVNIHAPHLAQSQTHFLVHIKTQPESLGGEEENKALVFHTDIKTGQIKLAYELPHFRGKGTFATSSDGANVYFVQIGEEETLVVSSDSHGILARWPNPKAAPIAPICAVAEVVKKPTGQDVALRQAVFTANEDWVLVRNGERYWTRHEGLSDSVAAVWAEIPRGQDLAKVLAEEAHTSPLAAYTHRVKRHIHDLQYLPAWLADIPSRVIESMVGDGGGDKKTTGLYRDSFGFNKILVVGTRRGRFYGLDAANGGRVLWTQSWFPRETQHPLVIKGLSAVDEEGSVVMYGADGEYVVFNASTGAVREHVVGGAKVSATAEFDASLGKKTVLPIGSNGLPTRALPLGWKSEQTIVIVEDGVVRGVKYRHDEGKTTRHDMWQLQLFARQRILQIATPPRHDPIASVGRVLGDRRVMYKYLDANALVVAAIDDATHLVSIRLVDGVSGQVLAAHEYPGVDASQPVSCTMAENWYACAFFATYPVGARSIQGHHLVVADLYESPLPNDRGPWGDDAATNSSALLPLDSPLAAAPPLPHVVAQAFVVSEPLAALCVSQTRQGITTRQLNAYLPASHALVGLPRPIIDPRRPVGRDPSAADVEAEGLMRYTPALEIDPRSVFSHQRDVLRIRALVPAPTLVESTSLLAAIGTDVYVARLAPSGVFDILGKGFNKTSLLATVLALLAGVLFLRPLVRRKQIDRRWEAFL
ncbi:hypothetical protein CDD81_6461 [Ophiocordyceps australis]|uniref:ER membrane protein complex subunit 1 n=1 Tax=Ophiocordyceps australis TaxID=1399860 RepID=A0A2C5YI14_9HYPO|nr:hypothetical protein CDD81_6461 [Ophiocordyceps australis]